MKARPLPPESGSFFFPFHVSLEKTLPRTADTVSPWHSVKVPRLGEKRIRIREKCRGTKIHENKLGRDGNNIKREQRGGEGRGEKAENVGTTHSTKTSHNIRKHRLLPQLRRKNDVYVPLAHSSKWTNYRRSGKKAPYGRGVKREAASGKRGTERKNQFHQAWAC